MDCLNCWTVLLEYLGQKRADSKTVNENRDHCTELWGIRRRKPYRHEAQLHSSSQPMCTKLIIEAGPADLEELRGLGTVVPRLLESLKNARTFGLASCPACNTAEIALYWIRSQRYNVLAVEFWTGGGDDRPFEIMLQFSHISRPWGLSEGPHRVRRCQPNRLPVTFARRRDEVLHQEGDIIRPLTKRRKRQGQNC